MDGYPKTLYPRVGGGSITVASPEQEKRLGEGWVHHPPFPVPDLPVKRRGRPKKVEEPSPDKTS
jgi:hypothetical protein